MPVVLFWEWPYVPGLLGKILPVYCRLGSGISTGIGRCCNGLVEPVLGCVEAWQLEVPGRALDGALWEQQSYTVWW